MLIEDFDILSILGNSITSASYKVKHKQTEETFVWQTLDYSSSSDSEKSSLLKKITKRINLKHPNTLKFHDYIDQKENKLIYLITDFCKNGTLKALLQTSKKSNKYLQEELICKILYQTVCTLKTLEEFNGSLSSSEILLDDDFNIKLFNFSFNSNQLKKKELKMHHLGIIVYEMCTLKEFEKSYEKELKELCGIYSNSFLSLISHMLNDSNEVKKHIDKILCHPTLLLKSNQWSKEKCFVLLKNDQNVQLNNEGGDFNERLQKLRNREIKLQVREQKLLEKEHKLANREKKVLLMERIVKEKLQKAELYLKRCKEAKSNNEKQKPYEDLDTSCAYSAHCDNESVIAPTSKKLNVAEITKPAPFRRSLSERRIRFKGHSPLKEVDFNRAKSKSKGDKRSSTIFESKEWLTCSEQGSEKSGSSGKTRTKVLFKEEMYANGEGAADCRPISWTEESKKQAFDLLRIMNGGIDKENIAEVKHTYL